MNPIYKTAGLLSLFALIGTSIVVLTHYFTQPNIQENFRQDILNNLNQIIAPGQYDNDLLADSIQLQAPTLGNTPITVYRAYRKNNIHMIILTPTTYEGYNGEIKLLVGINVDHSLAGVRVIAHKETPGLGDAIETRRSNWISHFDHRSLNDPLPTGWKVKKDGGDFDQLTGATITPRAIVKLVYQCLIYAETHHASLFQH